MNTRLALTNRIAMTSAALLAAGAIGVTGLARAASSADSKSRTEPCPSICPKIYKPVICVMSDHSIRKFGNRCEANVYACKHRLTILACWPAPPEVD